MGFSSGVLGFGSGVSGCIFFSSAVLAFSREVLAFRFCGFGFSSQLLDCSSEVLGFSSSEVFGFSSDLLRRLCLSIGIAAHRYFCTSERRCDGTTREMWGALAPPIEHLVYISAGSSWRFMLGGFGTCGGSESVPKSRAIPRRSGVRFWGPKRAQHRGPEAPRTPLEEAWQRRLFPDPFWNSLLLYFGPPGIVKIVAPVEARCYFLQKSPHALGSPKSTPNWAGGAHMPFHSGAQN